MDLVPHTPDHPERRIGFLPNADETGRIWGIAKTVAGTSFVPKALRGDVPAIMAAMLTGRELGILPMRALRQVSIIEGKPTPSPELMAAMALKAGHDVYVAETTRERCVVEVRRSDWPDDRIARLEWTLEDAVDAGLCSIDPETGKARARSSNGSRLPWEAYTRAMLRSRAISEACRTWLPDVVEGASYAPEELGATVTASGHDRELVDAAAERGEPFDPLEGESDEVRAAVAEAMGEEPQVDPATGEEITDAEIVDEDDEDDDGGAAPPAPQDGPDGDGDAFAGLDPEDDARTASRDLVADAATEARTGSAGDVVPSDEDPAALRAGRSIEEPIEVDLADVPDPTLDEPAYAAWLAEADAAYRELNVGGVAHLIRDGWVDLEDGRRLAVPSGRTGLDLVARFEEHTPGPFRRTVRGALESAGWVPSVRCPGDGQDGPGSDVAPSEGDAKGDAPSAAPARSESVAPIEHRRGLLRRWKSAHRELSQVDEAKAREALAARLELGAAEDEIWSTFDLAELEDLVVKIEAVRASVVPF